MDTAKRNRIIKNILIIISVLVFFGIIGYGIYSTLKSIGIDKPICGSGQTNYSEYDDGCYEKCDDDQEPCPSFDGDNKIPTKINCVPKCKDSDNYDFDDTNCNDGTCTTDSDKDNCKFYCKAKKCDSPSKLQYSKKDGWYCGTSDQPEWSDDSCPNTKWKDTNPKELNIWETRGSVSCDFTNKNPIIFINNTRIKFNITLNYVLGYVKVTQKGGGGETFDKYSILYKDKKCILNNVVGESGVYKADEVLACAQANNPNEAVSKPTYESIAPGKNIYNDFTPSSQIISVLNFYSLTLNNDNNALVKTLNNSYSNSKGTKISLGVYNTSEYKKTKHDKNSDLQNCSANKCFDEFPLSKKKYNTDSGTSGFWKFETFGCKLGDATNPAVLKGNNNFVTFKLENDTGYYFGIVTTSDNTINKDVYIGKSGVLYFGDYCKLINSDCNKLGIPSNLGKDDWNYVASQI